MLANLLSFLNGTIIPFLMALAFLVFLWNAFRYFILGGDNPGEQEKARSLAFWSIVAFVVITSMWGLVNMVTRGLDLNSSQSITPDYMKQKTGGGSTSGNPVDNFGYTDGTDTDINPDP